MRVLFVIAHVDKGGGQAVQALQLVERLLGRVDGEFIGLTAASSGLTSPGPSSIRTVGTLRFPGGILDLRRAIRARRADVDIVHALDPYYALPAARLARAHPLVFRLGAHPVEDLASRYGHPARFLLRTINPWLYSDVHVVVNARHLASAFPKPVTFIPNGVDLSRFAFPADRAGARRALDLPLEAPIATFTGKIVPRKNIEDLYWLAREIPSLHLLLVGTDQEPYYGDRYHREVQAQFADVRSRVHSTGELPMDRIPACLAATDLFIFPSRLEGMPNSVLEAMAAGLPILAFDTPAHREIFPPGTGALFRDRPELLERAQQLLADPAAMAREGKANRAWAEKTFSLEAATRAYLELYERILPEKGR